MTCRNMARGVGNGGRKPGAWLDFVRHQESCDLTIAELLARHAEMLERKGKLTRDKRTDLRRFGHDFGTMRVRDFERAHARGYRDALQAQVLSDGSRYAPKTVRKIISNLTRVFAHAVEIGAADLNPVAGIKLPPNRVQDPTRAASELLTTPEVRKVLSSTCLPPFRRVFYAVLFGTGSRFGEAAALRFGDVSLDRKPLGEVLVRRSWDCRSQPPRFREPKTELHRRIPVVPFLRTAVLHSRNLYRETWGIEPGPDHLVAPYNGRPEGPRPWHQTTALRWWRKDLELLGIEHPASGPRRLHATRHTYINLLIEAGASEAVIKLRTHPGSASADRDPYRGYVHYSWDIVCREIGKLKI